MICPKCAHDKTVVVGTSSSTITERMRKCQKCGFSFMTLEVAKYDPYLKEYVKEIMKPEK